MRWTVRRARSLTSPAGRRRIRRGVHLLAILAAGVLAVGHAPAQDLAAPSVSGVSFFSTPASGGTYQRGDLTEVQVTFDRRVAVTGTPQLNLTIGAATRAAALDAPLSRPLARTRTVFFRYTVQEGDVDENGISIAANAIRLNGGTIKVAGGATDADLTHAAVPDAAGHKVDGGSDPAPAISGISFQGSPASGDTYQRGEFVEIKVVFDRYVVVRRGRDGTRVALTIGGQTRLAAYLGSGGTGGIGGVRDLFFRYEVQEGDVDTDGISIPANAVRLNGATITSEANRTVNADLTHAAVAADATRKVDGSKVRSPSVTNVFFVGEPDDGSSYRTGETIGVAIRLDPLAKIDGTAGLPTMALNIGTRTRYATLHQARAVVQTVPRIQVGIRVIDFQYTVEADDWDGDGISIPANAIRLNGAAIIGLDGSTDAVLTHSAVSADPTRKVGGATPPPTTLTLSAAPAPAEGGPAVTVTAALDNAAPADGVTVTLSVDDSSTAIGSGADYTLSSTTVEIAAGSTDGTTTITVTDDAIDDDDETIILNATSANPTLSAQPLTLTIADNDGGAPPGGVVGGGDSTPSSNANLSGLTASSSTSAAGAFTALTLTPSTFSAATTSYAAAVANTITHVKLTPTVQDTGNATVAVAGTTVTSGSQSDPIALGVGANTITVRVMAESGTTKDYAVTVTRQAPTGGGTPPGGGSTPSSNANLSGLTASSSTSAAGAFTALALTPSTFSAATTSYAATVANAITHVKLTPTVQDTGNATVAVAGTTVTSGSPSGSIPLSVGENPIEVVVTAEDGTTRTYRVTVTRQEKILGAAEKAHVDRVGKALLGLVDPGVSPPEGASDR